MIHINARTNCAMKNKTCECCYLKVEEVFLITMPYKGELLPYEYCESCLNHIQSQIKKIKHEKISNH